MKSPRRQADEEGYLTKSSSPKLQEGDCKQSSYPALRSWYLSRSLTVPTLPAAAGAGQER